MNTEQMDKVIKATVDNLSVSEGMALNLDLRADAIEEAVNLGYVERRGNYLYPTDEGTEYRKQID